MFGRLTRGLQALRLLDRCDKAYNKGLGAPMSKTKLWSIIAGIGAIASIAVQAHSGTMQWTEAIPAIVAIIGTVVAAFKMRDAVKKSGPVQ